MSARKTQAKPEKKSQAGQRKRSEPSADTAPAVQPGKVLFEMEGVDEVTAREAFRLAGSKLSVSTSFVKRQVR